MGYSPIADKHYVHSYGGVAAYIRNNLFSQISKVEFHKCFILIEFSCFPSYSFYGVYIQPVDSKHFELDMFSDLASSIYECIENERVPFVGGDFNSRLGDLNNFAHSIGLNWKYSQNMDSNTNSHSRLLRDLCNLCKVLPFNHL